MFKSKFSIQLHRQRKRRKNLKFKKTNHYDIRILSKDKSTTWSWAIPKSKFPEKGEKLLAIRTPDHPVSYMYFQGTLDNGDKVSVIDRGECKVLVYKHNLVVVFFRGKIVKGVFNFIKIHTSKNEKTWIIIKSKKYDEKQKNG